MLMDTYITINIMINYMHTQFSNNQSLNAH